MDVPASHCWGVIRGDGDGDGGEAKWCVAGGCGGEGEAGWWCHSDGDAVNFRDDEDGELFEYTVYISTCVDIIVRVTDVTE